jgi:lipoprotein NlpI
MFRRWLGSVRRTLASPKPFNIYEAYAPRIANALHNRGNELLTRGDPDGALQAYNDALIYQPKSALVFNNRACVFLEKEEYDRALQDCNSALESDPALAIAFCNRGSAYLGKGNLRLSVEDYDQSIGLDPNYHVAYTNRACLSLISGEHDCAIQDSDRAITLKPSYSLASRNRGVIAFCMQRFEEAQNYLARAVELDGKAMEPLLWLNLARRRAGEQQVSDLGAGIDLRKWPGPLVSLLSGSADEHSTLAIARNENPDQERGHLCGSYFIIGELALLAGQVERARTHFRKSLETGAVHYLEYCAAKSELDHSY